jgi:hypothetical protein
MYRKQAGPRAIYPKPIADSGDFAAASNDDEKKKLYLFNCAQRAHG